jgi:hypothetical protein
MAPPYIGEESAAYLIVNRHKRGIVLNLKHESGREALLRLSSARSESRRLSLIGSVPAKDSASRHRCSKPRSPTRSGNLPFISRPGRHPGR